MTMTPAVEPTHPSELPQYRGRAVPWITRWSQEVHPDRHNLEIERRDDGGLRVVYLDRARENRDKFGVLWMKEGLAQGQGEPLWKEVNTHRQRACMIRSKCQVCGKTITDKPIHWLLPLDTLQWVQDEVHTEATPLTASAPTCEACIPLALDVCPNLKAKGWQLYYVLDWGVWGVRGMHHFLAGGTIRRRNSLVPYDLRGYENTPAFEGATLAQQLVVVWNKFMLKEEHRPSDAEVSCEYVDG